MTTRNASFSGPENQIVQEIVQFVDNLTLSDTNSLLFQGATELHSNQLYECRDNKTDARFGYLLIVLETKSTVKFGNLADWSRYRENVLEPTNGVLQSVYDQ